MTGRIAYFSPGLSRLKDEIRLLSGLEPRLSLLTANGCEAVAGWGHKPTAKRARAAARRSGIPYLAFEDGFLRSLKPGPSQRPAAMVMDRTGIYYDARTSSDLETIIETATFTDRETSEAQALLDLIARHRLSKYNHGRDLLDMPAVPPGKPVVLVIDQTAGDESVAGALSDAGTFARMLEAAVLENPDATLVAKLHPETVSGAKPGYIGASARDLGFRIIGENISPHSLFELNPRVYTVSSQFGFEALLAGLAVTCFGTPFYAGWGLTDDRASALPRRTKKRNAHDLAAAAFLRYCRYFDCWTRKPVDALTAADQLAFLRRNYLSNGKPVVGYRIARWKRRAVSAMLEGPHGPPKFTGNIRQAISSAKAHGAQVAAWGIEAVKLRPALEAEAIACLAVEDGFLRSVGLGAAFVQPLSLVFDGSGLYYDPTRPSDIETMLESGSITDEDRRRASSLRRHIVEHGITKYNVAEGSSLARGVPADRTVILVPGQVADDWAVRIGRPADIPHAANINEVLLERVRQAHPNAFVIFKPHPDVEHLGRVGALNEGRQRPYADLIARDVPLDQMLPLATRIETYSSLAGFEALLRGIPVTVHGLPFYAGWGLTEDRSAAPRRHAKRSLDELAAVALIRYPRYWDPVSGLACPPEVALQRIAEARKTGAGTASKLGLVMGRGVILARRFRSWAKGSGDGA
jgi:capsular polysaccharide export protein